MRLIDAALRCPLPNGQFAYIAPELKQAKRIAWNYLKAYGLKVPGSKPNESELWVEFPNGARVFLYGADNPESFRGLYFDGVVLDEVAQMKREIWDEIVIPALADRKGWALFIGTPKGINLFSDLYFRALVDPDWSAAKYTIHDTKVFTPEEIESIKAEMVAAAGSDRTWRQEMLCDFLASDDNALISIDEANAAANRIIKESEYQFAPRILGVDVAWSGGDRSVIFPRQGLVAFPPIVEHGLPEKAFAVTVARAIEKFQAQATFIDNTGGYGGEVVSRLRDGGHKIYPVNFAWKPSDPRFLNLRAEIWFKMADWVKNGGSIPNRPSLISEMCAPTFSNDNAANKMKLESKDDVKDRLGVSPDEADALALTWAFPVVAPLALGTARAGVYQAKTEYDMYGEGL